MTRSGFIGLAGRPNVGKSTLVNAIVGAKVAIISDRPQTTRRASRGVATDVTDDWQLVLVDLPGVQRPRDVAHRAHAAPGRARARGRRRRAVFVVNGEQGVGPGDRFIADHLLKAKPGVPVICAVNKIDRLDQARDHGGAVGGGRAGGRRRGLPGLRPARHGDRAAGRSASPSSSPRARSCIRRRTAATSRARSTSPS